MIFILLQVAVPYPDQAARVGTVSALRRPLVFILILIFILNLIFILILILILIFSC